MFSASIKFQRHALITIACALFPVALWAQAPSTNSAQNQTVNSQNQQQPTTQSAPAIQPEQKTPSDAASADQQNQQAQQPQAGDVPTAQAPDSSDQGMFVFKKQVEEVVLHATVTDQQRRLVPNLDKSAFAIYQNNVPQPITSFRREDVPVAMGIVIDNSGSMRDKRDKVNQAVMNLIRVSNPEDEIFVVNFSDQYYLDQDFTSDPQLLQAALHQTTQKGSTALYDAIVASAVHLANNHRLEKKVLLVITDGQDNMSQETLQEATRRLEQVHGPALYSIGLVGASLHRTGYEALQNLADGTGGVAYFPDTINQVDEITRTIAKDIRSQYILAYRPTNQKSQPQYQSLRVDAHAPGLGPLTVRTRTGIYQNENPR